MPKNPRTHLAVNPKRNLIVFRLSVACLFVLSLLSSCALNTDNRDIALPLDELSAPAPHFPTAQYHLAAGDILDVKFPSAPEFSEEYLVQPDGRILLAFIGPVMAAGKTPYALQQEIEERYAQLGTVEGRDEDVQREYRIAVGDHLDIRFPYQAEFNESAVVRPDGKISLPLIGTVSAESKTPEQLTVELSAAFESHLREPELVVMVRAFTSNRYYLNGEARDARLRKLENPVVLLRSSAPLQIFVGGEVRNPGFLPYAGPISAMQAIIVAGGNTLDGEMRQVAIIRKGQGEQGSVHLRNLRLDFREQSDGNLPLEQALLGDVQLQPNDVVIVPRARIARVSDFLNQYLYDLIPALRNSSFGFVYNLRDNDDFNGVINVPSP